MRLDILIAKMVGSGDLLPPTSIMEANRQDQPTSR